MGNVLAKLYRYRTTITAACAVIIAVCFFLPWIRVHMNPAAKVNELLGYQNSAAMVTTSGAGIPVMANGPSSRNFLKVAAMFSPSMTHADKKSYLVWLVPVLPILVLWASVKCRGNWIVSVLLGTVCSAIAVGVAVKIWMTDLNGIMTRVDVCPAFWVILLAFLATGVVHFLAIPIERTGNRASATVQGAARQ